MRLLREKIGVVGHVAFCESMISGENVDISFTFLNRFPSSLNIVA